MPRRRLQWHEGSTALCATAAAFAILLFPWTTATNAETPPAATPAAAAAPDGSQATAAPPAAAPSLEATSPPTPESPSSDAPPGGLRGRLQQFRQRLGIPSDPTEVSSPIDPPPANAESIWATDVSDVEASAAKDAPPKTLEERLKDLEAEIKKNKIGRAHV